ncbi:MAG TPA: hypothetical protein VKU44_04525, partial [Terriglobia bacterium]|nr:hypothetical protein [Terriglobia bacterium]
MARMTSPAGRIATLGGMAIVLLLSIAPRSARPADAPLTKDDIRLLLIGGASADKMIALIGQRGVDFQLTPDLAKKFHDDGASDAVIDAIQKAGEQAAAGHAQSASAPAVAASPAAAVTPPAASTITPAPAAAAPPAGHGGGAASLDSKISDALAEADRASAASTGSSSAPVITGHAKTGPLDLSDPGPARVEQIIQEFAAKEKVFKEARDNYTYHQINKVETLDADGRPDGVYQQEWDILFDDKGNRIEHVTYAPLSTLSRVTMTAEDENALRSIQPFVMTTDDLPDYEVKYLGHVKVDQITAYVFSIRPKELKKGRQYFQGVVWVDDQDLQIVKTEGKPVGELKKSKGENLFPRFTTYREQIDGKFWFPTFTVADDKLYFSAGPV